MNGNPNCNGKDLIEAAEGQMVVVNFNYRVGPYGFLAGKDVVGNETLSLNNGLKDQRQLLKWVQDHIDQVGTSFSTPRCIVSRADFVLSLEATQIMLLLVVLALGQDPLSFN